MFTRLFQVLPWRAFRCLGGDVRGILLCFAIIAAALISDRKALDFRVYSAITRSVLLSDTSQLDRLPEREVPASSSLWNGNPLYGDESGLDNPWWYRYPPAFMFAVVPFAALPYGVAVFAWAAFKGLVLAILLKALAGRLREHGRVPRWLLFYATVGVFLYLDFWWANVQSLIFALTAAALLWLETRPAAAASALGAAIAFKVWPLAFVPYLAALGRWRVAGLALLIAGAVTVAPIAYFGWPDFGNLMRDWFRQEHGIATAHGAISGQSQSLLDILSRHLTEKEDGPRAGRYPDVSWLDLSDDQVHKLWLGLTAAGGLALLWLIRRAPPDRWLELHGVAFCALSLFAPYTTLVHAVFLVWPALIASGDPPGLPASVRWLRYGAVLPTASWLLTGNAGTWPLIWSVLIASDRAPWLLTGHAWARFGNTLGMYALPAAFLGVALSVSILRASGRSWRPRAGAAADSQPAGGKDQ